MPFWEEKKETEYSTISDEVVDLSFRIRCKTLPRDHIWGLSQAILKQLPWFADEPHAALHQILVAESGNGWLSPEGQDALHYPSRRTRLTLRLPKHRINETISALEHQTVSIHHHTLQLTRPEVQLLSRLTTLYARFAIFHEQESEEQFLIRTQQELAPRGIHPRKMICGKLNLLQVEQRTIATHSLMLADLSPHEAILLQQKGLHEGKNFGCGVFLPHKTVENLILERE
ncbi:MAG: type I-MYXAN CRISPR-associated protein Cas6/Cmx6 [Gammaproteobacteria bacterium]|jgi:CRISPR-associated protein Cas6|nr:type I-MYXAN CRISPR-associated protein Cas6/Cmx6 [Gammaproteobacteria bacterium]MBT3490453.1 type I-MYXAN CRISPR-associated protein Cas6/Cmx6 [Gammaproteobacteria bacterium]MBT3717616.1 type I-MYXAN CRISPR-associated protein Cas6/Cmx6 [Gammaproteobacteria bacterium]MBT3845809.1 type I-MYXAN CRISPR-associated protein Cas6/Cmx6 [Gammaproteobacteria bacterium]MBT3893583.1 type I-MYXAN CRISPR-associated protein Cas6/Cmx6 [Gammaproteobacteria bacterium]